MSETASISVRPGVRVAYLSHRGEPGRAGFLWLGGFNSDMTGSKAESLAALARAQGRPCLRFDYSGHGQSEGRFADGTISLWLDEATTVFTGLTDGPTIVVGSSMGGYLAVLLLRRLGEGSVVHPVERACRARQDVSDPLVGPGIVRGLRLAEFGLPGAIRNPGSSCGRRRGRVDRR